MGANMKKILAVLLSLFLINQSLIATNDPQLDKPPLTVWIRSFGKESATLIAPYLKQVDQTLSPHFHLRIVVATKPGDPVLKVLEEIVLNCLLTALQAELGSISQGLNALIEASSVGSYILSLSQGVEIHAHQVREALSWLNRGAWAHGWQVSNLQNDGSAPGKGWYHTAALYPPSTLLWMKAHPFPYWIDNGVDGHLMIDGESIPIGDNEEVVLMARVIKEYPEAFFVHNTRDILHFTMQTGNGITFEQKLKRKVLASDHYLKNRLQMSAEEVWSHLLLITEQGVVSTSSILHSDVNK
jgi:hypothetical protein